MRRGLLLGIGAYVWWGLSPLFWKLLDDVSAGDVVAHRALWAFVLLVVVHTLRSSWPGLRSVAADRRNRLLAMCTAGLIAGNWLVFLWAVAEDRVLEVALGYFINPLVSVVLGVVLLRERMRAAQWVAVALAALGVGWFVIEVGSLPWVSLVLAATFAIYGLLRKTASFGSVDGLTMETALMSVGALVFLTVRALQDGGSMGTGVPGQTVLLILAGGVTAVPLLLFAESARRVPLSVVGLLQYLAPTIQFLLGVWVFDETFDSGRLVGFAFIWAGLVVFVADGVRVSRPSLRADPVVSP